MQTRTRQLRSFEGTRTEADPRDVCERSDLTEKKKAKPSKGAKRPTLRGLTLLKEKIGPEKNS